MAQERFDITIRVANADNPTVYTEVQHSGCPQSAIEGKSIVGSVLEEHLSLREQNIRHLEVTI